MMLDGLNDQRNGYEQIRSLHLPNSVAPALRLSSAAAGQCDLQPELRRVAPS